MAEGKLRIAGAAAMAFMLLALVGCSYNRQVASASSGLADARLATIELEDRTSLNFALPRSAVIEEGGGHSLRGLQAVTNDAFIRVGVGNESGDISCRDGEKCQALRQVEPIGEMIYYIRELSKPRGAQEIGHSSGTQSYSAHMLALGRLNASNVIFVDAYCVSTTPCIDQAKRFQFTVKR